MRLELNRDEISRLSFMHTYLIYEDDPRMWSQESGLPEFLPVKACSCDMNKRRFQIDVSMLALLGEPFSLLGAGTIRIEDWRDAVIKAASGLDTANDEMMVSSEAMLLVHHIWLSDNVIAVHGVQQTPSRNVSYEFHGARIEAEFEPAPENLQHLIEAHHRNWKLRREKIIKSPAHAHRIPLDREDHEFLQSVIHGSSLNQA